MLSTRYPAINLGVMQLLLLTLLLHTIPFATGNSLLDQSQHDIHGLFDIFRNVDQTFSPHLLPRAESQDNSSAIVLNDKPSDPDDKLDWDHAVSKGNNLMKLLASEDLSTCGVRDSNFTEWKDLDSNGWTSLYKGPPRDPGWESATKLLKLHSGDQENIQYNFGQFENVTLNGTDYPRSGGLFMNVMNTDGAILALNNVSPRNIGSHRKPALDGSPGKEFVPLQSWAHVAFIAWADACKGDKTCIRRLNTVVKCNTTSKVTDRIATGVLRGKDGWESYPGKTFKNGSEELAAILATPIGRGVAWLLLTHREQLGWKYIQAVDLWSERVQDSQQHFYTFHIKELSENQSSESRVAGTSPATVARSIKDVHLAREGIRPRADEWEEAVAKGKQYLSMLKCGSGKPSEFKSYDDLADWGWKRLSSGHPIMELKDVWKEAIEHIGAQMDDEETWTVYDRHMTETAHEGKTYPPTSGVYENTYNPEFILSSANYGPRYIHPDQDTFPKLERLSDVLFLEFQRLMTDMNKPLTGLKGSLQDVVVNDETERLAMKAVGTSLFDSVKFPDWPGVDFDADSDELAALVASPNGRAPVWLLAQHKEQLGHKTISSVRVFGYGRNHYLNMLFKFEDVDESPSGDDDDNEESVSRRTEKNITSRQAPSIPVPQINQPSEFISDAAYKPWVDKGKAYLELLNCGKGVESKWTSYDDLGKYGWERRSEIHPLSIYKNGGLDRALKYLKASSKGEDQWQVTDQHTRETTVDGKTYYPTGGKYNNKYNMEMICSDFNFGPKDKSANAEPPVTGNPNPLPPLEHYSDVVYLEFVRLMKLNNRPIDKLKGVLRSHVVNRYSRGIVEKVIGLTKDDMVAGKLLWPGKDFEADSDELAALVASPNGRGVAWLLATHKDLGRKTISQARVYFDGGIYVLFVFKDLDEASGEQVGSESTFQKRRDLAIHSTGHANKPRALSEEKYFELLERGKKLVEALQSSEDCFPQSRFTDYKALKDWGWVRGYDAKQAPPRLSGAWPTVFDFVNAPWDNNVNRWVMDSHVDKREIDGTTYYPTGASYGNRYNPTIITSTSNFGPAERGKKERPPVTGNPNPYPLLTHQSDVMFLEYQRVMQQISDEQPMDQLKAVWRHNIINEYTRNLCIKFAAGEYGFAIHHIPVWPGKDFSAGSDELAALVGSPNGVGVAYLLLQHRQQMGRKKIAKARVWYDYQLHVLFLIDNIAQGEAGEPSSRHRRDSAYADAFEDAFPDNGTKQLAVRALDQADYNQFVRNGKGLAAALESSDECVAQSEWTKDDALAAWGCYRMRKSRVGPVSFFTATKQVYEYVGASMNQDDNHRAYDSHSDNKQIGGVAYYKTGAEFDNRYNPNMIIAENIYGAENEGINQNPPVTGNPNLYPKLRFWSDVTFLEYQKFMQDTGQSLDGLEAVWHRVVSNQKTRDLAARLFRKAQWTDVPDWPGRDFLPGSDDFHALIGSNNGKGVAYLLLQHREQLGAKTITKVRVWKDHTLHVLYTIDEICDDESDSSSESDKRLIRRIGEPDSEVLQKANSDGRFLVMAQDSTVDVLKSCLSIEQNRFSKLDDLKNSGWTLLQNTQVAVEEDKDAATFDSWLDMNLPLTEGSNHKIEYQHLKETKGSDGQTYYPSGAYYRSLFSEGAIAALDSKSPWSAGRDRNPRVDGTVNPYPPLKQWSDETFVVYKNICKSDPAKMTKLKGVLRHGITNDAAKKAFRELLSKDGGLDEEGIPKPWPGTLYKLGDDGFHVALGLPNGKGVAYLLATNREALGWKEVYQIRIFSASWASAYNALYYIRDHKDNPERRDHIESSPPTTQHGPLALRNAAVPTNHRRTDDSNDGPPSRALDAVIDRAGMHQPRAIADEDYENALKKGSGLLCKLHSDNAEQSAFTEFGALAKYGWDARPPTPIDEEDLEIALLLPMAEGLDLPLGPDDNVACTFKHVRDSKVDGHFYPSTSGTYEILLNAAGGALIATESSGPSHLTKADNLGPGEELVALQQWSDVAFLAWKHESGGNIRNLKYIVQSIIINPITVNIIGHILESREQTVKPWPGLKIPMTDPDAQALLGSPNGGGVAWLLIQHKEQLGLKVPDAVTIYGRSSRSQSLVFWIADKTDIQRRDDEDDVYENSKMRGIMLLCRAHDIDPDHNSRSQWTEFRDLARYGWKEAASTPVDGDELRILRLWDAFQALPLPMGDSDSVIRDFGHKRESRVQNHFYPPTHAQYKWLLNVAGGTIAATSSSSPAYTWKATNMRPGEELIPLKQWSDITFLTWQKHAGNEIKNLKYVFQSLIINKETEKVIHQVLSTRNEELVAWPGVKIPMTHPDGQALLGTPNGRGVAWLLIQHKKQLGLKVPEAVTIYGGPYNYVLNLCFWITDKTDMDFELGDVPPRKRDVSANMTVRPPHMLNTPYESTSILKRAMNPSLPTDTTIAWPRKLEKRLSKAIKTAWASLWLV